MVRRKSMPKRKEMMGELGLILLHLITVGLVGVVFVFLSWASVAASSGVQADSYKGFGYPWEHNNLGLSDEVPPPWTEIQLVDNTLKCWGRQYLLGNGMLPRQISSQGQELFQNPPAVNLKIGGENALPVDGGKVVFTTRAKNRVEYKTLWQGRGYRVEAISSLEFDGLFRVDLSLQPQGRMNIEELVLTFPFQKKAALAFSRYLSYDYETQRFDRAEVAHSTGLTDKAVSLKFNPAVWIGNHDVGMEWVCETNAGWSNADPDSVIQISPEKDAVVLQIKVVSKTTICSSPFTLSFALYPTPVKKLPDDWREWLLLSAMQKVGDLRLYKKSLLGIGFGLPTKYPGLPIMDASEAKGLGTGTDTPEKQISNTLKRMREEDVGFVPYGALYGMPALLPGDEWKDYGPLWKSMHPKGNVRNPRWAKLQNITDKKPSLITICPYHRSFQDFIVWQNVKAIEKYHTAGCYLDLSTPGYLCQNLNHPHGKFVAQGVEYYPFFSQRELMKRLFIASKSRNRDFMIIPHHGKNLVICSGFADMVLSGESLNMLFIKSNVLSKTLEKDILKAQSAYVPDYSMLSDVFFEFEYSQNKGYVHVCLPQVITKSNEQLMRENPKLLEKYSESLFARAVVYDIPLYFERMDKDRYRAILQAEQRAGVLAGATYLGPWECRRFLAEGSGKLKASCYLLKGGKRVMLMVANLSDRRVQETLKLNLHGLKQAGVVLPQDLKATDGVTSKPFPLDQGRLTLELEPNGFYIMMIQ
jgi:hypothetical protein